MDRPLERIVIGPLDIGRADVTTRSHLCMNGSLVEGQEIVKS
jgi:hypothetical protein